MIKENTQRKDKMYTLNPSILNKSKSYLTYFYLGVYSYKKNTSYSERKSQFQGIIIVNKN